MKKREFNKCCRLLWGKLKKGESNQLPKETRHQMLLFVVKNRGAIHNDLITDLLDKSWIASMGYMYKKNGFLCTSENLIQIKA
jgi:hypothetical protein